MIYTGRTITVGEQESIIDKPILLYRGDRDIIVEFTLIGNNYSFAEDDNVIKSTNASHGQLVLNTPSGENMFTDVSRCIDGKVKFLITHEMIDELDEVGLYSFQIRLFDESQQSRVSIPPVMNGFELRRPIASEDENNLVDLASVDYSVIQKEGLEENVFNEFNYYNKTGWKHRDVITSSKLNKIENALYEIHENTKRVDADSQTRDTFISETIDDELAVVNAEISKLKEADTSLSSRIDANSEIVDNRLSLKSDITYVDRLVAKIASGSPKGAYRTLSELQTAKPRGDENIYVISEDGCWYFWDGTSWCNGGVYQSTSIADGTIDMDALSESIKSNASNTISGKYLPSLNKNIIDVDTINKTITIGMSRSLNGAYSGNRLSGNVYSSMDNGSGSDDVVLSYAGIGSSAVQVLYDITNKEYYILAYNAKPREDSVLLGMVRLDMWDCKVPYGDSSNITINNGNPSYHTQGQIDKGVLNTKFFTKTIWNNKANNIEYMNNKMVVNVETRTITIPKAQYGYGNNYITISESYDITYDSNSTFIYIFYKLNEGRFVALTYADISNKNFNLDSDDYLLYDIFRTYARESIYTDEILFTGKNDIEYINMEDLFNPDKCYFVQPPTKDGSAIYHFRIADEHNLYRPAVGQIISNSGTRWTTISKTKNSPNMVKIRKKDNIQAIRLENCKDNDLQFAVLFYSINGSKVELICDSNWCTYQNSKRITYQSHPYVSGIYIDINNLFKLAESKAGHSVDEIFATNVIRKVSNNSNAQCTIEDLYDLGAKIHVIKYSDSYQNDDNLQLLDLSDAKLVSSTRIEKYVGDINPWSRVRLKTDNVTLNYNGGEYRMYMTAHFLNSSKGIVFDPHWQKHYIKTNIDIETSICAHWYRQYVNYVDNDFVKAIESTKAFKVYIGIDHVSGPAITNDITRELLKMIEIKYAINEPSSSDSYYVDKVFMSNTKETASLPIVALADNKTYVESTKLPNINIPSGCKCFNVEFRAKVSDGTGYIQFGSKSYNKMSIVNTKYKSFKMRFNKNTDDIDDGAISITVPTGGSLSIQGLSVNPCIGEIQNSSHNEAKFYHHRGYSYDYPENSLLALIESCKRGCSIIELDIFTTSDGKLVAIHDNTTGRTSKDRPTITLNNTNNDFMVKSSTIFKVSSSMISEFAVNDQLSVKNDTETKTVYITKIDSDNNITVSGILPSSIISITNNRTYVPYCTEAEFMDMEIGGYKDSKYYGEMNEPIEEYIKVANTYDAALLLDVREITESAFKNHLAPLLDKYKYWDKCYFMHSIASVDKYHLWAKQIDRKIVGVPILWTSGDALTSNIQQYGSTTYSNMTRKDVCVQSSVVTKEQVDLAHSYGMRVYVFTVNSMIEAQRVFRLGVDVVGGDIFSDDNCILW